MSIRNNRTTLAAAALAGAGLVGASANADFYQFTFGGEITTVKGIVPEPWETVHVGSEFEYTYIFDSEAEDQSGSPWKGWYDLLWAQVTIEGVAQATQDGLIIVEYGGIDNYTAYFFDLPIGAGGDVLLNGIDVLDSDDLLLDINLDDWLGKGFEVGGDAFSIKATVTSFSGQIVPAPATLGAFLIWSLSLRRSRHCLRQCEDIDDGWRA